MSKTKATLTEQDFINCGMGGPPSLKELELLGSSNIEVLAYSVDTTYVPTVEEDFKISEIYWALSPNNEDWYIFRNSLWQQVSVETFYTEEFTKAEVEAIPETALEEFFTEKKVYFKACLIPNRAGEQPAILSIAAATPQSYFTGYEVVYSGDNLSLNASMWLTLDSVAISCVLPENTNIYFLFSKDNRNSWLTYTSDGWREVSLNSITSLGMSVAQVHQMQSVDWEYLIPTEHLDVAIALYSSNPSYTPSISRIFLNHSEYDSVSSSNIINVKTPPVPYKKMIMDDEYLYTDVVEEGIGFDDKSIVDYWYTTPNKIHLRVYSIPTLIGSRTSEFFLCKLRNTYETEDFDVVLTARYNGQFAEAFESEGYGLFYDSAIDNQRTKIEFAKSSSSYSEYPFKCVLMHKGTSGGKDEKIFYFRITPTSTTTGRVNAEIVATYFHHLPS